MSRTKNHKDIRVIKITANKMKPYLADKNMGYPEYTPDLGRGTGISKTGKLVAKNANRSRKKAARQEAKNVIKRNIDSCD